MDRSTMVLLPRDAEFFYRKGVRTGFVRVEVPGVPVPISAPASSPIRCVFGLEANLKVLGERIRDAGRELNRDLERDSNADGFVVLECLFADESVVEAIQKRFWSRMPTGCWSVTLISPSRWTIQRLDLKPEQMEILKYAALDP